MKDSDYTPRTLSATTIIGDQVRNPDGDSLGKVEEIMIDQMSGHVAYAVVSFGGFLGMGNKLFAVPWQALTPNSSDHEFVLDIDKSRLQNAPGFDKDDWPAAADRTFLDQVHTYYQVDPYYDVRP